uniref:Uncharacterized protein n=1 Tax=Triatoma infestans TaxID=30076 RepID=A0A170U8T4_TRIIF
MEHVVLYSDSCAG